MDNMIEGPWTIEELSEHVADALAGGFPGQPSGRVREVPDRRTIRWYTTIGLVDRPAAMRGRTALYDRRHLLQLVAIKRLQTRGLALANIQEQLLGAMDEDLERIASIPAAAPPPPPPHLKSSLPGGAAMRSSHSAAGPLAADATERTRFWATPPSAARPAPAATPKAAAPTPTAGVGASITRGHDAADPARPASVLVHGVRLGAGVRLLLDGRQPDATELAAIVDAAAPLLDILGRLNLTSGSDSDRSATNRSAPKGTP